MINVPEGLVEEIGSLLRNSGLSTITWADILGQVVEQLPELHYGNSIGWMAEGMAYSYIKRHNVVDTIKQVVAAVKENPATTVTAIWTCGAVLHHRPALPGLLLARRYGKRQGPSAGEL